ncbi:sensor histidine kinase [Hamadaea tsunoensis]|uniref:sensor histidine kinase n=1 Tax=Hamadaea tsunoensis TaxID=53368 RepID=UPI0006854972|nr:sensor histidine kinase [Hamadaea tsunoensis]
MRRQLAISAAVGGLAYAGALAAPPGRVPLDGLAYALLALAALAIAFRWRAPVPVLAVTTVAVVVYIDRGYPGVVPAVPMMFALYAAVKQRHRAASVLAIVITVAVGFAGQLMATGRSAPAPDVFQGWFLLAGWMVAAGLTAEFARQREATVEAERRRAEFAERTREETARRRADAERLRIARELHDSLTHSISIIKVQAGVAVHLARKHDQPVPEALLAIQEASGDAMRELRATLEVLRDDHPSALQRLDALVAGARRGGLPVQLTVHGAARTLPAAVDQAAYRIIQEALTNTARHAGPAAASVELHYEDHQLGVRVQDTGSAADPVVPGVGLSGMRERVTALGGSLATGPMSGGGFAVHAVLPLPLPATGATS